MRVLVTRRKEKPHDHYMIWDLPDKDNILSDWLMTIRKQDWQGDELAPGEGPVLMKLSPRRMQERE